jgi:hypothetical protein
MLFAAVSLHFTTDLGFGDALLRITRRTFRSIAFRQLVVIAIAIFLVRFALNNLLRLIALWSRSPVPWDKSKLYSVMKEVRLCSSSLSCTTHGDEPKRAMRRQSIAVGRSQSAKALAKCTGARRVACLLFESAVHERR